MSALYLGSALVVSVGLPAGINWLGDAMDDRFEPGPITIAGSGAADETGEAHLSRTHDGLLDHDSLLGTGAVRDLADRWEPDPGKEGEFGWMERTDEGLVTAVDPTHHPSAEGEWQGYFAVTDRSFPEMAVVHVQARRWEPGSDLHPRGTEVGNVVLAVQTGWTAIDGAVDFVAMTRAQSDGAQKWTIAYNTGYLERTKATVLAQQPADPQDGWADLVVRTDGEHRLWAWLDGRPFFGSDSTDVEMTPPFQVYIEVQALDLRYASIFRDFWVTESDRIEIAGLQAGENVSLVSTTAPGGGLSGAESGDTIGQATAGADGRASLVIPAPLAHGEGRFEIDGVGTSAPLTYSGGDSYVLDRTGSDDDAEEEP